MNTRRFVMSIVETNLGTYELAVSEIGSWVQLAVDATDLEVRCEGGSAYRVPMFFVNRVLYHVLIIRVVNNATGEQVAYHSVNDPIDAKCACTTQLEKLYRLDPEGAFDTFVIDGWPGQYVATLTPAKVVD